MPAANERQEGGDHYKQEGKPQHWDLAVMYRWDPFQYQITKYVMRWKDKHPTHAQRLVDLKKARHFLDKYIEVAEQYDPGAYDAIGDPPLPTVDVPLPFLNTVADSIIDLTKAEFSTIVQQASALGDVPTLTQNIVALTQTAADIRKESGTGVSLSPAQIQALDQSSTLEYQNEGYLGDGQAMFKCMRCRAVFTALTTAAAAASHGPSCPGKQTV